MSGTPFTVSVNGSEIVIRLVAPPASNVDELVPIAECGLERRAADRAVREGKLKATRQGRCLYVRRSDVLKLVETDPATTRTRERRPKAATNFADVVNLETRRARQK